MCSRIGGALRTMLSEIPVSITMKRGDSGLWVDEYVETLDLITTLVFHCRDFGDACAYLDCRQQFQCRERRK